MSDFQMIFKGDPESLGNPELLKALCQKEVDIFEAYVKSADEWFEDGLVKIERNAIAGYLYQKAKGRLGGKEESGDPVS